MLLIVKTPSYAYSLRNALHKLSHFNSHFMYKETNAHEYHSTNRESTNQHNTKYQLGRSFGLFKIGS